MRKIAISLFLLLAMVVSMAVPAFAATPNYPAKGASFDVHLIPEESQAEVDGETVWVNLVLFCEYNGEEIEEFDLFQFSDTITYNDKYFELVDWEVDEAAGLDFEFVEDGEIVVSGKNVEGLESGVPICSFELRAIGKGSAALTQVKSKLKITRRNVTGDYTITTLNKSLQGVRQLAEEDGEYTVSAEFESDYGKVYLSQGSAEKGEEVWFRVVPNKGYEAENIVVYYDDDGQDCEVIYRKSVDDNGSPYYYFKMPDAHVTVEVDFDGEGVKSDKEHDIEVVNEDPDYGFVRLNTYSAKEDTKVRIYVDKFDTSYTYTITVEDSSGKTYKVSKSSTYSQFTMPDKDVTVTVEFSGDKVSMGSDTYYVEDVTDSDHGTVAMPSQAKKGTAVKVYVFPEAGYVVDDIIVFGDSGEYKVSDYGDYYRFTMPDETVFVEVLFMDEDELDDEHRVYLEGDDDGTVRLSSTKAPYDEKIKIWVDPDSGYEVDKIEVTEDRSGKVCKLYGDEDSEYYYFYMPRDDVYVYISYEKTSGSSSTKYDIDLSYNSSYGSVDVSKTSSVKGKEIGIYPEPKTGYVVDSVKVTRATSTTSVTVTKEKGDDNETFYTFKMPAYDVKVTVNFVKESSAETGAYKVNISSAITNGTVEVSKSKADNGATITVTPKPATGYEVDTVTVTKPNNTTVTVTKKTNGTYTFTMPTSSVTVKATFKKTSTTTATTYKVTVDSTITNGTVTVSKTAAAYNEAVTVTPKPATGYEVDKVTVTKANGATIATTKNTDGTYKFNMPTAAVTVDVSFKKTVTTTPTTPGVHVCPAKSYADVKTTEWYHDAVDYVISNGLMGSTSTAASIFEPGTIASRAMIVTIIWRIDKQPLADAAIPFTDIPAGQWYTEAIRWAAANDILKDVATSGAFEPNAPLTREQIAAIIYRYEQYKGGGFKGVINIDVSKFKDANEISPVLLEAIGWCNTEGVLKGNDAQMLMPKGNVDRAQLAQILMNYTKRK